MHVTSKSWLLAFSFGRMVQHSQCQFTSPTLLEDTGELLETQNSSAASFIGAPAVAKQLRAKTRYLPEITGFHQDGGNTRTNDWDGPLGNSPQISSRSIAVSAQYWHDDGRLTARTVCEKDGAGYFCIAALDPDTLDMIGSWAPESHTLYTPYAATTNRTMVIPTLEGYIYEIERMDDAGKAVFSQLRSIDLTNALPQGHSPSSSYYDDSGNIWFTAVRLSRTTSIESSSYIGYANADGVIKTRRIDNQTVENSIAISSGIIYVNTGPLTPEGESGTGYMHAFQINADGDITPVWEEEYDAGTTYKPGAFSRGSGSTPALVGDKFVAMTDNADVQVNLVAYRQVEEGVDQSQSHFVCKVPLFQANASANENAMIGYFDGTTYSVVINNNYGSHELQTLDGNTVLDGDFNQLAPLAPGITRVDISDDGNCTVRWDLQVRSTSVLSLSTSNGLVYSYTQDEDLAADGTYVWYFTAIDFASGEIVWRIRSGAGGNFNNNVAPTQMSPNGGLYQVVLGGVAWLKDGA